MDEALLSVLDGLRELQAEIEENRPPVEEDEEISHEKALRLAYNNGCRDTVMTAIDEVEAWI